MKVKTVVPCKPSTAQKHTGYQVGGIISPLGTRTPLPVYIESFPLIYINAGKRGLLVKLSVSALAQLIPLHYISMGIPNR